MSTSLESSLPLPLESSRKISFLRVALVLMVVVFLGRIATNDFTMWDDHGTLTRNPNLNPPTFASVASYWKNWGPNAPMGLYVPVTYTIWGALAWVGTLDTPDPMGVRLNPTVFHLASLAVHATSVLVVFEILRRLVRNNWAAFIGAAVFAVHPVQVETVAWTSGLKDLLCAMFSFTALLLFINYRDEQSSADASVRSQARRSFMLGTAALVLGMLSKPTAMVVPALALVIDWLALGRPLRSGLQKLWPWFVLSLLCALMAKWSQPTTGMPQLAAWTRPFVAGDALAFYAVKLVFPYTLVIDYARTPQWIFETRQAFYTPLLTLALGVALFVKRKHVPLLVAAAGLFVVAVSPVLGFVPFMFQFYTTVADHYLYMPMLGVALAVAWFINRFPRPIVSRLAVVVLLVLGVRSFVQAGVWKDDFTLNFHNVTRNPRSFIGNLNIVRHYLDFNVNNPNDKRSLQIAEGHALAAVNMRPEVAFAHDTLAQVYVQQGRILEAMEQNKEYIRLIELGIGPVSHVRDTTASRLALGAAYASPKIAMYDQAIEQFTIALSRRPGDPAILRAIEQAKQKMSTQPATRPSHP